MIFLKLYFQKIFKLIMKFKIAFELVIISHKIAQRRRAEKKDNDLRRKRLYCACWKLFNVHPAESPIDHNNSSRVNSIDFLSNSLLIGTGLAQE